MKVRPATSHRITPRSSGAIAPIPGRHLVGLYPKLDPAAPADDPRLMMCVFRPNVDEAPRFVGTAEEAAAVADALNLLHCGEIFPS